MKELEKIKEFILKQNGFIKSIEFGDRIVGVDFSIKYPIIIDGELMKFFMYPEIIQDLKLISGCDIDPIKECSTLIMKEYEQLRESRRRSD